MSDDTPDDWKNIKCANGDSLAKRVSTVLEGDYDTSTIDEVRERLKND